MATITLSIPERLKSRMDETDTVNWSAVARHAFIEQLRELDRSRMLRRHNEIVRHSQLTEADADLLADKIKESMVASRSQ